MRFLAVVVTVAVGVLAMPLPAAGVPVSTPLPVQQTGRAFVGDGVAGDSFGYSVAVDGNTAVIGVPGYTGEGAVFVYEYNGAGWVFSQKLPADPAIADRLGHSVDISGDYIVVGCPFGNTAGGETGYAVVYQRTPSGWTYLSGLEPESDSVGDRFGWSVSLYGTTAVVGSPMDNQWAADAGAIYIFRQGLPYVKWMSSYTEVGSQLGTSVDISGNYLVAGAPRDDNAGGVDAGMALVYYGDGAIGWSSPPRTIYCSSPQAYDNFGYSVATNGVSTMVGIRGYNTGGQESAGRVDVFTRSGSGPSAVWPFTQYLASPEPNMNDYFGESVSVNGSVAAVGASWDDGLKGSVHVYEATASGWALTQKVRGAGFFGTSVAASHEGKFVVGAMAGDGVALHTGDASFFAIWRPVYRFYNAGAGTHFFTDSAEERDHVIATWPTIYSYEGVAYSVNPYNNKQPLYRFYKPSSSSHFYTASLDEANHVLATWPHIYSYDGPTYQVSPSAEAAKLPVYRFYHKVNGSHFYTASLDEANHVIVTWPHIYTFEGPAFWLGQ
jgi:hypothetical protein